MVPLLVIVLPLRVNVLMLSVPPAPLAIMVPLTETFPLAVLVPEVLLNVTLK